MKTQKDEFKKYLTTIQTSERLGLENSDEVSALIRRNKFPNAVKIDNRWYIPISDIKEYEKMQIKIDEIEKADYLTTIQVCQRLRLKSSDDVSLLIRNNKFPNAVKLQSRWHIPISDIAKYEKEVNAIDGCLTVKQVTVRLGYKIGNRGSVLRLIGKSALPNAFRYNGQWWIPENDVIAIEEKQKGSLDAKQASERLKFKTANNVHYLINKKVFPNAFRDYMDRWRIPLHDIEEYEKKNDKELIVNVAEAKEMLGVNSNEAVLHYLRKNSFPNAFKHNNSWRIPRDEVEAFILKTKDCLSTAQAANRLGYTAEYSVIQLIEKSILPDAFKFNSQWWIPISNIEEIEQIQSGSLDTTQTAQRLNYKSSSLVVELIGKNKFPSAFKDIFNKWRIPMKDIIDFEKRNNTNNCIDLKEAAKRLGYKSLTRVRDLLENNYFPNAFKSGGKNWIPIEDFEEVQKTFHKRDKPKKKNPKKEKPKKRTPKTAEITISTLGFLATPEVQKKLKIGQSAIINKIKKGDFPSAFQYKGKWWIPEADVEKWAKEIEQENRLKLETLTVKEVADRIGYTRGSLGYLIKQKKLPNAFKIGSSWRIPITDVEEFEKSSRIVEFTSKSAFEELTSYVESIDTGETLKETKELYLQFCLFQINKMNGTTRYKRDRVLLFKRLYKNLISSLVDEIFLVSSDDISSMLSRKTIFRQDEKKSLIVFIRFVYHKKNIEPAEEFSLISNKEKLKSKEIYSPEQFHEVYQYVKDSENRTKPALKDRSYANMWTYTILLLTDFIRGQDLIAKTPNIDLNTVGINSLDWFSENKVSEFQAQSIINQLYTHFRYKRASKNDELLTFIVAPDLIKPLATALVISELHRRIEGSELLLDTFVQGAFDTFRTAGKISHRNFFNEMKGAKEFKFGSRLMNQSVGTYLFYTVTEEDGQDSDLALHLTQVSRSHKSPDTTSQYIQATNKDGSINRVSYNLFKRGHFGWLYNYLILYVSQFEGTQDTLEQRSNLIEQVRKDISPSELENVAKFVNDSLVPVPLKNHSDSMQSFIQRIYYKRQTLVSKLKEYAKEEIREIITKLANGDLPAKNEHAQCLVFPNCKNPQLSNCFSCEYVIPGNLMLIQLNEELNRLIDNIEKTTNEVILQRESRFLMHALFIWKEARIEFGDDRVKAYIDIEETWKKIENVSHKILMD